MILLHMRYDFAWPLMYQAHSVSLMDTGYVWLTTDGVTIGPLPTNQITGFSGLLGTRPMASKSNVYTMLLGRNDKPSVSETLYLNFRHLKCLRYW